MKIEAYARVVFGDADEPSTKVALEPVRVLFEESCIIYGFKPIQLGIECRVVGIEVDGESAKCSYKLGVNDTFNPGMKYYYPTTIAQCGIETTEPVAEIKQEDWEDARR